VTSSSTGADEVAQAREKLDCLKRFRARVTESGELTTDQLDAVDRRSPPSSTAAVDEAKAAPKPAATELLTDVYVTY